MAEWAARILNETVRQELRSLPAQCQAKFAWISPLIITHELEDVTGPHTRLLREKLWEMRLPGKDVSGRVLYTTVQGCRLIVLHAFVKKTDRVPQRAIRLALQRMKEISDDNKV